MAKAGGIGTLIGAVAGFMMGGPVGGDIGGSLGSDFGGTFDMGMGNWSANPGMMSDFVW